MTVLPAQTVVAALGFIANIGPIATWGLELLKRHIVVDTTMRTNVPRVFAAGDIVTYPGKVPLISVGFGEAALAVNNAAPIVDPGMGIFPGPLLRRVGRMSSADPRDEHQRAGRHSSLTPHGTCPAGTSRRQASPTCVAGNDAVRRRSSTGSGLGGRAAKGLAIITCMDSRIDPLGVVGMKPGDVKILRNAGARVTDDVLRTLVLADLPARTCDRVLVVPHTRCAMVGTRGGEIHAQIAASTGWTRAASSSAPSTDATGDAACATCAASAASRCCPAEPAVAGAVYDVDTGDWARCRSGATEPLPQRAPRSGVDAVAVQVRPSPPR